MTELESPTPPTPTWTPPPIARFATARKLAGISYTGMRRMFRDLQAVFFVLVFPMLLVLVLGLVFGGGFESALGVVVPDDDPLAAEVVASLDANDEVEVFRYGSAAGLRDAVEHGRVQAGAVIPDGYSERLRGYGDPLRPDEQVEVMFFAGPSGIGQTLRPVVSAAVDAQSIRVQAARFASRYGDDDFDTALQRATELEATMPEVTVRSRSIGDPLFENEDDIGTFVQGASSQLVLFMFVIGVASSVALIQSRQLGVSHRMLSTPTSARVILFGEGLGRFTVVMFQGAYIMLGSWLLFGVDWGDPLAALVVLTMFGLVATGAAMLAGALFRNDQQAGSVGVFVSLGLAALGGSMAPLEVFPPTMRTIAHVTPHAWANEAFGELVVDGGGLGDVLTEVAVLLAMAAVLLTVASWRLRRALTT